MYMMWYEPDKRVSVAERVGDAIDAYRAKWGREPREVVLHPSVAEAVGEAGVPVRVRAEVRPTLVYVGDNE